MHPFARCAALLLAAAVLTGCGRQAGTPESPGQPAGPAPCLLCSGQPAPGRQPAGPLWTWI